MLFKDIYLDSGATTRVDERVLIAMLPYFTEKFGNASSAHSVGQQAHDALEKAQRIIEKSRKNGFFDKVAERLES